MSIYLKRLESWKGIDPIIDENYGALENIAQALDAEVYPENYLTLLIKNLKIVAHCLREQDPNIWPRCSPVIMGILEKYGRDKTDPNRLSINTSIIDLPFTDSGIAKVVDAGTEKQTDLSIVISTQSLWVSVSIPPWATFHPYLALWFETVVSLMTDRYPGKIEDKPENWENGRHIHCSGLRKSETDGYVYPLGFSRFFYLDTETNLIDCAPMPANEAPCFQRALPCYIHEITIEAYWRDRFTGEFQSLPDFTDILDFDTAITNRVIEERRDFALGVEPGKRWIDIMAPLSMDLHDIGMLNAYFIGTVMPSIHHGKIDPLIDDPETRSVLRKFDGPDETISQATRQLYNLAVQYQDWIKQRGSSIEAIATFKPKISLVLELKKDQLVFELTPAPRRIYNKLHLMAEYLNVIIVDSEGRVIKDDINQWLDCNSPEMPQQLLSGQTLRINDNVLGRFVLTHGESPVDRYIAIKSYQDAQELYTGVKSEAEPKGKFYQSRKPLGLARQVPTQIYHLPES